MPKDSPNPDAAEVAVRDPKDIALAGGVRPVEHLRDAPGPAPRVAVVCEARALIAGRS